MDEELKRIEDEIRKAKEKRQALEDRKVKKLRQIRARQERDRAAWLKKLDCVMDKTLSGMKGKTYFYGIKPEQIADAVSRGGIRDLPKKEEKEKAPKKGTDQDQRRIADEDQG